MAFVNLLIRYENWKITWILLLGTSINFLVFLKRDILADSFLLKSKNFLRSKHFAKFCQFLIAFKITGVHSFNFIYLHQNHTKNIHKSFNLPMTFFYLTLWKDISVLQCTYMQMPNYNWGVKKYSQKPWRIFLFKKSQDVHGDLPLWWTIL